jgi:hypothetical protein
VKELIRELYVLSHLYSDATQSVLFYSQLDRISDRPVSVGGHNALVVCLANIFLVLLGNVLSQ